MELIILPSENGVSYYTDFCVGFWVVKLWNISGFGEAGIVDYQILF